MTAEQRDQKLKELDIQRQELTNQIKSLEQEGNIEDQQKCLKWVSRAFQDDKRVYLITGVPMFTDTVTSLRFNKYQFPCITVEIKGYSPPDFESTLFIKDDKGPREAPGSDIPKREISFAEFRAIYEKRMTDILMLASTAKMRQTGTMTYCLPDGTIYYQ